MSKHKIDSRAQISSWSIKCSKWIILAFIFIGIFHRFIANDLPIVAKYNGSISFPVFTEMMGDIGIMDSKRYDNSKFEWRWMPLIPYSSDQLNSKINVNVGPFDTQEISSWKYRHWLGTDELGRDVTAGLINGTNIAMKVGLISVFFALLLGLYLGVLSGYYGDDGLKMNIYQFVCAALIKIVGLYYLIFPIVIDPSKSYYIMLIAIIVILLYFTLRYMSSLSGPKLFMPIDLIVTKITEVLNSIPTLFVVLGLLAVFSTASIWNVVLIIALIGWPKFARLIRAEIMQIKNLEYIQSAKSIGLTDFQIITKHALVNALTSVISITAFAISNAILLESTLSFLGLGIPLEQVSWGSMLSEARANFSSWWLAFFPGFSIFLILISFYIQGNNLNERMNLK